MLRFIRERVGGGSLSSALPPEKIKDLFSFSPQSSFHGFPHHPTALGWDPELRLLALTTKRGVLRAYGQPGVEYSADLSEEGVNTDVREIHFLPGKRGQIVLLTEDGLIQLWEIVISREGEELQHQLPTLEKIANWDQFVRGEGNVKTATTVTVYVQPSNDPEILPRQYLLVGTEAGNIHVIDLQTFLEEPDENIIKQEDSLSSVPLEYKKSSGQGPVEVIQQQPGGKENILIGYQRGILIIWDQESRTTKAFFNSTQQLQSASWVNNGFSFLSSHNDGSYITWRDISSSQTSPPSDGVKLPYGPFPCKPIGRVVNKTVRNGDDMLFFTGGMPRATYGDKYTVSIIQGDVEESKGRNHVLDFSSKVVDFVVIDDPQEGRDNPTALIVLLEEEIAAIDLRDPEWLPFKLPHLSTVHFSGITACQVYASVPGEIFHSIIAAGRRQDEGKYSKNSWPIKGGVIPGVASSEESTSQERKTNDLLITGHEDGSICFWDVSSANLSHILTITTRKFFHATDSDVPHIDGEEGEPGQTEPNEEEWPPFKKVGVFDPYSDDPRLAIRRVLLCPMTGVFVAAGTAGQVFSFKVSEEARDDYKLNKITTNIVEETAGFVWKGHEPLRSKTGVIKLEPGFHPDVLLQITPPASVTAVSLHTEWNLLAAGTAHGFVVVDLLIKKVVLSRSTLNPADLAANAGGDVLISRRKSFKKSLRESFRRLRRGRSSRKKSTPSSSPAKDGATGSAATSPPSTPARRGLSSPVRSLNLASPEDLDETRPVERQIEAKSDDGLGSMIRTIVFTPAVVVSGGGADPTLWIGTNAGSILIFTISIPSTIEKRLGIPVADPPQEEQEPVPEVAGREVAVDGPPPPPPPPVQEDVSLTLAKEIQLRHRAPVIFIQVVDGSGFPIPNAFEVEKGVSKQPSTIGSQKVLIISEEQLKLFTLPTLKPDRRKVKVTANEGSRVRRVIIGHFVSKADEKTVEHVTFVSTNQGEVSLYSIGDLKRIRTESVVRKEDVHGISSVVLSSSGEGLFMHSPSEFVRFSFSAKRIVSPTGRVEIAEGVRPSRVAICPPPSPVPEQAAAEGSLQAPEGIRREATPILPVVPEEPEPEPTPSSEVPVAAVPPSPAQVNEQPPPPSVQESNNQVVQSSNQVANGVSSNQSDNIVSPPPKAASPIVNDVPRNEEVHSIPLVVEESFPPPVQETDFDNGVAPDSIDQVEESIASEEVTNHFFHHQEPDADKLNGGAPVSLDWATANEVDDFLEEKINGQKVSPSPNLIEFSSHVEIPSHHENGNNGEENGVNGAGAAIHHPDQLDWTEISHDDIPPPPLSSHDKVPEKSAKKVENGDKVLEELTD